MEAQRGEWGGPPVLQSSSGILPLLPEPDTVAGSAVGVEEGRQVAFTFRGLWVKEVISRSEDEKGEELRVVHILGDLLEATRTPSYELVERYLRSTHIK